MSNLQLTILFIVVAVVCTILHFVLGSVVLAIAGVTLFGVWTGAGAWCSWVGLVNLCAFWMSCIQMDRLFAENTAAARVSENLQELRECVGVLYPCPNSFGNMILNPLPESSCVCKN